MTSPTCRSCIHRHPREERSSSIVPGLVADSSRIGDSTRLTARWQRVVIDVGGAAVGGGSISQTATAATCDGELDEDKRPWL